VEEGKEMKPYDGLPYRKLSKKEFRRVMLRLRSECV